MSYGVGHRGGSDPELLWFWRGLAATAWIGPLAWERPYVVGAAQEMARRPKKKKKKKKRVEGNITGSRLLQTFRLGRLGGGGGATAWIGPLAWERPYGAGAAQEMERRQKKKKKKKRVEAETSGSRLLQTFRLAMMVVWIRWKK